jgi:integrase
MGRKRKNLELGLEQRVYLNHGAYFYVHPNGKWERLGSDKAEANQRARLYNDPGGRFGTMVYWLDMFLVDCEERVKAGSMSPRTLEDYKDAVGTDEKPSALRIFFAPPMTPLDVEPHMVQEYLTINARHGRPVPANREKACLSSCIGWLIRSADNKVPGLKVNPCLRASGIKRNPEAKRDRYVTHEEFRAVYKVAHSSVQLTMELTYRTLQRPESDIIHWTNEILLTEDGQRKLHFRQGKTGKAMKIATTPELDLLIKRSLGDVPKLRQHIIHTRNGQPYTYDGLSAMLKRAIRKVNTDREAKGLLPFKSFGFRDLKGKGATDMWRDGVPIEVIQHLCGHEDKATTEIYVKQRWHETAQPNQVVMG